MLSYQLVLSIPAHPSDHIGFLAHTDKPALSSNLHYTYLDSAQGPAVASEGLLVTVAEVELLAIVAEEEHTAAATEAWQPAIVAVAVWPSAFT